MDVTAPRPGALSERGILAASSWMTGAHVAAQAVAYGSLIILAHLLPPGSFGIVAAGTAVVWIAVVVMDSGAHGSIVVSRGLTAVFLRRAILRCLAFAVCLGAAIVLGAQLLVGSIAGDESAAAVAALALCVPVYALAVVPLALLQRAMEFRPLAGATAASNIAAAAVAVVAGVAGAGVWALVTRQLLWFVLLAGLAAVLARPYFPRGTAEEALTAPRSVDRWFLVFRLTLLVGLGLDYLVIGGLDGVAAVGLYAMAFVIAFAPVEHFSAEVGKVLFAAAAASNRESSGARTVQAVRVMSWLLLPVLPPAIVLAPVVVPAVLGDEWKGMVAPLQLLLVVGVSYAILNCIGEALSGCGEIAFRATVNVAWSLATLVALLGLVALDGIRGAALAHLIVLAPYAAVYLTAGARRIGTSTGAVWRTLRPVVVAVSLESAATGGVVLALRGAGVSDGVAAVAAALAGVATIGALVGRARRGVAGEGAALLRQALRREA